MLATVIRRRGTCCQNMLSASSVPVPAYTYLARQRRRGGGRLCRYPTRCLQTLMKSANSCTSDSADHHLTSMPATERLNPIVTWPPSAKGHHDPWSAQVKKSSLTARGRQN